MADKALIFDGLNNHVACGDFRPITVYTAECWIKANALSGSGDHDIYGFTIMASAYSGLGYPLWLTVRGTEVRLWAFETTPGTGGWRQTTGANLTTTDWFYIVATAIKGGATKIYVNGAEKLSFTNDGEKDWTSIFTIGDLRPDRKMCFDGIIDEIRISDTVRTPGEILTNWNNGNGKRLEVDEYTIALWHMDEGEGDIIYDETTNHNDGSRVGPSWVDGFPFLAPPLKKYTIELNSMDFPLQLVKKGVAQELRSKIVEVE